MFNMFPEDAAGSNVTLEEPLIQHSIQRQKGLIEGVEWREIEEDDLLEENKERKA